MKFLRNFLALSCILWISSINAIPPEQFAHLIEKLEHGYNAQSNTNFGTTTFGECTKTLADRYANFHDFVDKLPPAHQVKLIALELFKSLEEIHKSSGEKIFLTPQEIRKLKKSFVKASESIDNTSAIAMKWGCLCKSRELAMYLSHFSERIFLEKFGRYSSRSSMIADQMGQLIKRHPFLTAAAILVIWELVGDLADFKRNHGILAHPISSSISKILDAFKKEDIEKFEPIVVQSDKKTSMTLDEIFHNSDSYRKKPSSAEEPKKSEAPSAPQEEIFYPEIDTTGEFNFTKKDGPDFQLSLCEVEQQKGGRSCWIHTARNLEWECSGKNFPIDDVINSMENTAGKNQRNVKTADASEVFDSSNLEFSKEFKRAEKFDHQESFTLYPQSILVQGKNGIETICDKELWTSSSIGNNIRLFNNPKKAAKQYVAKHNGDAHSGHWYGIALEWMGEGSERKIHAKILDSMADPELGYYANDIAPIIKLFSKKPPENK
ncbi:hypothetical protein HOD08_04660 [bacterium]|nr:hypothetical protein [bacterium]